MTTTPIPRGGTIDLASAGLLVPSVQAEPLPISLVGPSPCTQRCPAGINVKAYVSLIAEGLFAEALATIRRRCPLPAICGRICHHPCEAVCKRARYDEAVAIRSLKRFVADHERDIPTSIEPPPFRHRKRVAVIGSGPAGLTAAYDLRLAGYPVTVFEAESEPGGMLRYGIADYRLPRDVLDAEIDVLCRTGVEIATGYRLGRNITFESLRNQGYLATLLAVGAQQGRRLGIEGEEETPQIEDALSFLRRVNSGDRTPVRGRVVVIGGGSTAVEAARTALRLGADGVEILYRRFREELLADHEEVAAAEAEGVRFRFLIAPRKAERIRSRFRGLECIQVGLGEPDASGRRRPIEIPGSELLVECDRVLAAVSQDVDFGFLPDADAARLSARGRLVVDPATSMTGDTGLFAAGDAVTGPATVIEAIAAGHRAAEAMRNYLEEGRAAIGEQRPERRTALEYELPEPQPLPASRIRPALGRVREEEKFAEVERVFSEEEAIAEARRCLRCGPCGECRVCASSCTKRHVMVRPANGGAGEPTLLLRTAGAVAASLAVTPASAGQLLLPLRAAVEPGSAPAERRPVEVLPVRSRLQIERCRACGRCVDICPFHALSIASGDGREAVRLEPSLCRGCGLCAAVCPTQTAVQSALSAEWWEERLDMALAAQSHESKRDAYLVLACQRRAGSFEKTFEEHGIRVDIIRFRCIGQIDAGMLLELYAQPFRGILVAGCLSERCRFTNGSRMASGQLARAEAIVASLGLDPLRIRSDWSPDRRGDPLDEAVSRLVTESEPLHAVSVKGGDDVGDH